MGLGLRLRLRLWLRLRLRLRLRVGLLELELGPEQPGRRPRADQVGLDERGPLVQLGLLVGDGALRVRDLRAQPAQPLLGRR